MKKNLKKKFIDRDLSWLSFNERVLEEAEDLKNPLFERLKFIAIFTNNLDEFLMVRVAGIKRLLDAGYKSKGKFGWYLDELYKKVNKRISELEEKLYEVVLKKAAKDMAKNNLYLKRFKELNAEQKRFTNKYFTETLFPIMTPMAIDEGHPFPTLHSKTLAFAVLLKKYNTRHFALVNIPNNVPRVIGLPSGKKENNFILIDEIIRNNIDKFFKGYKVVDTALFRVLRDSELAAEEEYEDNLLKAIEAEIKKRPKAKVVSLEVEAACSDEIIDILCEKVEYDRKTISKIKGDLDLTYYFELVSGLIYPKLNYRSFTPGMDEYDDIFDRIKVNEFLLHLPYQSFKPTIDLLKEASRDKNVLAIKMTLYRTSSNSAIVAALKEAAQNKKQVTVLVEIKARFDEASNIKWAKELEEAGCHVIYGMAGMKIHSKIALIVRKEESKIRRYVHLSTGNYNEKTANVYTDCGYFTSNEDFARDISDVFNVITGFSVPSRWKRIMSSPYDMRQYFLDLIDKEIAYQKKYKNGYIFAKMNSLEDIFMIDKLYEASSAGVKVKLIIRGICCLIPGVKGLSENIEVRSIVGRFLEHSRIFLFNNNGDRRIFLSSADWMKRNLDKRIELLFEIYQEENKEHLEFMLKTFWKDNLKSRVLMPNGDYKRVKVKDKKFSAQDFFIDHYKS